MKLLLDTHAFIWINEGSERLSQTIKDLCCSGEHEFYLSMASPWEMQIKHQLGKLSLAMPVEELVDKNRHPIIAYRLDAYCLFKAITHTP